MELAPSTSLKEKAMKTDWDALLRFIIGVTLSLTLAGIVAVVLYSLVFVTQPMNGMAPNDEAFFNLITPLATFITGSLGTLLAMNKKPPEDKKEGEA
jgi:peptidoglycan/LPS O-acetylase OafA/YrhL